MKLVLCIFVIYIHSCHSEFGSNYMLQGRALQFATDMRRLGIDVAHDTDARVSQAFTQLGDIPKCAAFEIGYLYYVIHHKFRRMVDKYNVSDFMRDRLYLSELIIFLEEIEHHYWEITHISNMLHEVERKYSIKSVLNRIYADTTPSTTTIATEDDSKIYSPTWPSRRPKKNKKSTIDYGTRNPSTTPNARYRTKKNKYWTWDYGWEPEYFQWYKST